MAAEGEDIEAYEHAGNVSPWIIAHQGRCKRQLGQLIDQHKISLVYDQGQAEAAQRPADIVSREISDQDKTDEPRLAVVDQQKYSANSAEQKPVDRPEPRWIEKPFLHRQQNGHA